MHQHNQDVIDRRLGRLILLYDANRVRLSATTDLTFSEDVGTRFAACGWHVRSIDGHDLRAIDAAIHMARSVSDQPSLIVASTHIGYGSPNKQDTWHTHGEPPGRRGTRWLRFSSRQLTTADKRAEPGERPATESRTIEAR